MQVTRMDLDGAGSPMALVRKILQAEPGLSLPIPIEDLARQLDITEIRDVDAHGFEGGLITDAGRSEGFILVKRGAVPGRRNFTIGHELGHFLLTHHQPPPEGFRCTSADFARRDGKGKNAAFQWEVEANDFSALILMPPHLWKREMARFRDPCLSQVVEMARTCRVSKEAAARTFATYHDEAVAVVVVKDGVVARIYRNLSSFPVLAVRSGVKVPSTSFYHRAQRILSSPSALVETRAEFWVESQWGQPLPELSEQVFFQQNGYAMIMLWAESQLEDEEQDPDADRTAKQRLADRQARWAR